MMATSAFDNSKIFLKPNILDSINSLINIPTNGSVEEFVNNLIFKEKIPKYLYKELNEHVIHCLKVKTSEHENNEYTNILQNAKSNNDTENNIREWEKMLKEEMAEYGEQRCASDEELFATAYHKMVHSPALETMLQLEHMYSKTVKKGSDDKDLQIQQLSNMQAKEMNKALERLEDDIAEIKINNLASQHFEQQTLLQIQLTSELDTIKEAQRREYREWLMQMLEENQTNNSLPTPNSPLAPDTRKIISLRHYTDNLVPILEESFTIHLGSQLKQMHNIRILSIDVMDLCAADENESGEPIPQTLQTALNLYSNDLHGLVLMTDNIIGSRLTKNFKDICRNSTEFHFCHIEDQLEKINAVQQQINLTLKDKKCKKSSKHLQCGDFYLTKHSNLSQVHVIFHVVADDSLKASDINSRHPVLLGLRNILKIACSNDITSITIPLLLSYEMTHEMTISWCEKRAELVFKCIKGFMIEMASWGGSELKNLQFMLPQGISCQVFQSLTEMLPRIFKVSNPLVLT